ncbi:tetracenomycin C synthesis protein homolog (plasmid) [Calothrix sp. NIES-4071]|nr:tetracenomycin C synthesis protein homolog [Calothrix sp. NIES-4071]BAZ64626.1 tetracenomycin C synthesis protein homolog [Calothrix sp. NIES-4105]
MNFFFRLIYKVNTLALACILRGILLDNWARDYIDKFPQGTIIDVGVSLNTRCERLNNDGISYFEIDLPDTMNLRRKLVNEKSNRKFINGSILNNAWIEKVAATNPGNQPCLFIIEGVLQYLDEKKVKKVFSSIKNNFPGSLVAFDLISPSMIKKSKNAANTSLSKINAEFTWGLLNPLDIHSWDKEYKIVDVKTYFDLPDKYLDREFNLIQRLVFKFVPYPVKMVLLKIK